MYLYIFDRERRQWNEHFCIPCRQQFRILYLRCVDMDVVCKYVPSGVRNFIVVRRADKIRLVFLEITLSTCERKMGRRRKAKYVLILYKFVSLIKIAPRKLIHRFAL